jgi:hypothetical protein
MASCCQQHLRWKSKELEFFSAAAEHLLCFSNEA